MSKKSTAETSTGTEIAIVAPEKKSAKKATPQVDAMPGMTPLGISTAEPERKNTKPPKADAPKEDLCTFAFRLPRSEAAEIHKASGPGKASQFVRRLAVAAARRDIDTIHTIVAGVVTK